MLHQLRVELRTAPLPEHLLDLFPRLGLLVGPPAPHRVEYVRNGDELARDIRLPAAFDGRIAGAVELEMVLKGREYGELRNAFQAHEVAGALGRMGLDDLPLLSGEFARLAQDFLGDEELHH